MKNKWFSILKFVLIFLVFSSTAFGHNPDQSYIYFRAYKEKVGGQVELAIKDLNLALGLNIDEASLNLETTIEYGTPLPKILFQYLPAIHDYIEERIKIYDESARLIKMDFTETTILPLGFMNMIICNFELSELKQVPNNLTLDYSILFDKDPNHIGFGLIAHNWKAGIINNESQISLIFNPNNRRQVLDMQNNSIWSGFVALIKLGMWHIYIGMDHILFLLALVLPSVVRRREQKIQASRFDVWVPVDRFKTAFFFILKVVTLFTVAHSITLSLAALGYVNLPTNIVESIIALSIGLAAYFNIHPLFKKSELIIAFIFGLFHGLGFASVLGEKGLGGEYILMSLLGFNIGVEIGQIVIIGILFTGLYFIRKSKYYPKIIYFGSMLLIVIAIYWFIERFFDIDFKLDNYIGKVFNRFNRLIGLS